MASRKPSVSNRQSLRSGALAALLCLAAPAAATDLPPWEWQLTPALIAHHKHRETDSLGDTLNRESGQLQGLAAALRGPLGTDWQGRLRIRTLTGSVDYRGQTQGGAALNTRTGYRQYRAGLGLAYRPSASPARLTLDLEHYQSERDIRASGRALGLSERFTGWEAALGGEAPAWSGRLTLSGRLVRQFDGAVRPDLNSLGYGRPRVPIPDSWGADLGLRWQLGSLGDWPVTLAGEYQWRRSSRGAAVTRTGDTGLQVRIRQPSTQVQTISVSLSFGF